VNGSALRVLVVDDDAAVAAYFADCPDARGVRRGHRADASTALLKLDSDSYDVVLCDISMPGLRRRRFYRRSPRSARTCCNAWSSSRADPPGDQSALAGQNVRIVEKPVPVRVITALVEEWRTHSYR